MGLNVVVVAARTRSEQHLSMSGGAIRLRPYMIAPAENGGEVWWRDQVGMARDRASRTPQR
jgi:hypothetical protein